LSEKIELLLGFLHPTSPPGAGPSGDRFSLRLGLEPDAPRETYIPLNRRKIVSFIQAAEQGKYYRPMEAVSRLATIQAASESLGEDSLLRALAQEVSDLRVTLTMAPHYRWPKRRKEVIPINIDWKKKFDSVGLH
jgi:hypothetical protein